MEQVTSIFTRLSCQSICICSNGSLSIFAGGQKVEPIYKNHWIVTINLMNLYSLLFRNYSPGSGLGIFLCRTCEVFNIWM